MALPRNAENCLQEWHHRAHGTFATFNSWELVDRPGVGMVIAKWRLADAQPDDATITGFAGTADAYVAAQRSASEADAGNWTKKERVMVEALYQLAKVANPALTRAQYRAQMKTYWDALP